MHFRCPHCMNAIDVVEDDDWWEVTCPSCGTHISVAGDQETRTRMSVQEQLAHFELLERIGMGHFGAVWRARDTVLDRVVALKVSREQVDARPSRWSFLREARAASQLNHPNIVPIYEIGQAKGHTFIVSEYIEGLDLRRHLKRAGKLAPRQAAQIARDIARALHHAHEEGILHRDVKSGNILLDADMRPYLADFGLAKRNGAEVTVTRDGEILGTPAYMAPEQAAGRNSEVDARSDIYSLGAVLYEMLTGQLVFRGGEQTLVYRVIHEEPRSPRSVARDVPEDLSTICLTCLEKDPDDRYQTAEQLGRDLDRFLCGESIEARPPSVLERAWRWCRREPYKTIAAVATTVAFFLLGVAVWAAARIDREDLTVLPPWATDRVSVVVKSRPTGAQLLFVPLHPDTFEEHPEFRLGPFASGTTVELPAGLFYLVVAYRDHRTFHEVYRYVPRPGERPRFVNSPVTLFRKLGDGTYRLSDIELFRQSDVAAEMVRVAGGTARVELLSSAMQKQSVPDFFIDRTEFTFGMAAANEIALPRPAARNRDADLADPVHAPTMPLAGVSWFEAAGYAERVGKRLPYLGEYQYLSALRETAGGERENDNVPRGLRSVDHPTADVITLPHGRILGLESNAGEWVLGPSIDRTEQTSMSGLLSGMRLIWKYPSNEAVWPSQQYHAAAAGTKDANIGFRCVRSLRPRTRPRDFIRTVD